MRIGLTTVAGMMFGAVMFLTGNGVAMAGNMPGWSAPSSPAVSQQKLRYVRPVNRAGHQQPTATRLRPSVSPFQTWQELWDASWIWGNNKYAVRAAATVRSMSICQGDIGAQIKSLYEQFAQAANAGKDGDAAHYLAALQDKLMCLDVKSMWALDLVDAAFLYNAAYLPASQRQQAFRGFLNPALLVFDQIQYTGRSYSLPVLYHHRNIVGQTLANYSGRELGLWFYDYQTGAMQRYTFDRKHPQFKKGLMAMISGPGRFANGACSITEMVGQGFKCGGIPGSKSGGGGGGGAPGSAGGQLACMTAAASIGGMQGQMRCMVKAGGGGNSVGSWMARARPAINMRGILDEFCGTKTRDDEGAMQKLENAAAFVGGWFAGVFGKTPPVLSEASALASQEGADAARGLIQLLRELRNRGNLAETGDVQAWYDRRKDRVTRGPGERSIDGEYQQGCGASTNAVARANRLFSCTGTGGGRPGSGGSGPLAGQNAPGTRSMPQPGSAGGGGMSGLMACAMQGGSLVRTSLNDSRCQQSMCAPGQSCSCNGGGGSAPAEVRGQVQRTIFSPNRSNIGVRDPHPDSGVGGAPRWGGAGGPATNPFGGKSPTGGR